MNIRRNLGAGIIAATLFGTAVLTASTAEVRTADEIIVAAVLERLGADTSVSITSVDVPGPGTSFRAARPDPEGRLGKPMRFTLTTVSGTFVVAVATVHVVASHAVTTRPIARNETIVAEALTDVRNELIDLPLRRPPTTAELVGRRALRPMPAGVSVVAGSVVLRRTVEPGDHVLVVALSGSVEVMAEMTAADGGRVGDVVRAFNPETHQYVRGRVVQPGRIEVLYAR